MSVFVCMYRTTIFFSILCKFSDASNIINIARDRLKKLIDTIDRDSFGSFD